MTQISRFIGEVVPVAQRVTGDGGESAAPDGDGGFADYALVSLHYLRIYLDASYRMTIDLLKEMPQITGDIGLNAVDLPAPSTLCKAFNRISMSVCRVLLRQSAQLHDLSETLRSTPRSTTAHQPAATTASESATAFKSSKSRNSSIQRLKLSLMFTPQRIEKEATQTSLSRSPAETRTICGFLRPIRATTSNHFVRVSAISGSDR